MYIRRMMLVVLRTVFVLICKANDGLPCSILCFIAFSLVRRRGIYLLRIQPFRRVRRIVDIVRIALFYFLC